MHVTTSKSSAVAVAWQTCLPAMHKYAPLSDITVTCPYSVASAVRQQLCTTPLRYPRNKGQNSVPLTSTCQAAVVARHSCLNPRLRYCWLALLARTSAARQQLRMAPADPCLRTPLPPLSCATSACEQAAHAGAERSRLGCPFYLVVPCLHSSPCTHTRVDDAGSEGEHYQAAPAFGWLIVHLEVYAVGQPAP